jgi:hypothetical protein
VWHMRVSPFGAEQQDLRDVLSPPLAKTSLTSPSPSNVSMTSYKFGSGPSQHRVKKDVGKKAKSVAQAAVRDKTCELTSSACAA